MIESDEIGIERSKAAKNGTQIGLVYLSEEWTVTWQHDLREPTAANRVLEDWLLEQLDVPTDPDTGDDGGLIETGPVLTEIGYADWDEESGTLLVHLDE